MGHVLGPQALKEQLPAAITAARSTLRRSNHCRYNGHGLLFETRIFTHANLPLPL
jgi:hypothetical protein